jgi:hypothetical protein
MAKSRVVFPKIGIKEQARQSMILRKKYMRMAKAMKESTEVVEPAPEYTEVKTDRETL